MAFGARDSIAEPDANAVYSLANTDEYSFPALPWGRLTKLGFYCTTSSKAVSRKENKFTRPLSPMCK